MINRGVAEFCELQREAIVLHFAYAPYPLASSIPPGCGKKRGKLFAAMGVAVQIAQEQAVRMGRSTGQVNQKVLGV
jgi:hypothetical protein